MTSFEAMQLAIEVAKKGEGFVAPNPVVGCVILDKDRNLLASGYHAVYGEAHAEINALNQVKDPKKLEGAFVYVTLEPCAHEGKTGSCAKKLASLPIASVTYGLVDPFPLVAGKGLEILKKAGIHVEQSTDFQTELEELAEVFLTNIKQKRTFFALKVAASLDGQMAVGDGESQWITSELSRKKAHELRLVYDAVLTGVGTFLKDNPSMNIRGLAKTKDNKVVLLDPNAKSLKTLAKSNMLSVRKASLVYVCTQEKWAEDYKKLGVEVVVINDEKVLDLKKLSEELYKKGICSALIEGGPTTSGHFLNQKTIDRFYYFQGPKVLGRQNWLWSQGFSAAKLDQGLEFTSVHREFFENDLFMSARLKSKNN